jgi:hypothetical protein
MSTATSQETKIVVSDRKSKRKSASLQRDATSLGAANTWAHVPYDNTIDTSSSEDSSNEEWEEEKKARSCTTWCILVMVGLLVLSLTGFFVAFGLNRKFPCQEKRRIELVDGSDLHLSLNDLSRPKIEVAQMKLPSGHKDFSYFYATFELVHVDSGVESQRLPIDESGRVFMGQGDTFDQVVEACRKMGTASKCDASVRFSDKPSHFLSEEFKWAARSIKFDVTEEYAPS